MAEIKEGKEYVYRGDAGLYYGKKCTVIDYGEYKMIQPHPKSLVIIRFEGENGNWNCRAKSLEEIK